MSISHRCYAEPKSNRKSPANKKEYTETHFEEYLEHLRAGKSVNLAAAHACIPYPVVCQRREIDPEYDAKVREILKPRLDTRFYRS